MAKLVNKLKDLAQRAGRWLGLADVPAAHQHTSSIISDRFDELSWRDIHDQATEVRRLAEDLHEHYDYAHDLIRDVFLSAYKVTPELRDREQMLPSRLVNHQVISSLMDNPEFAELRRETAGDPYAAAMAVIAQATALRRMLDSAKDAAEKAEQAQQAQQAAGQAAEQVADALQQAAEAADEDGVVPDETADQVQQAMDAAEAADQVASQAGKDAERATGTFGLRIRATARQAAGQATEEVREQKALMAAWGVQPGALERMDFQQRAQLAQKLRTSRLAEFAKLIGRFRQMATAERARKVEHAPGEFIGVTLGSDITRLVPSEMIALGVPSLRPVFLGKFAENRLLVYDSRGEDRQGQGAIVACIDCSGSMRSSYGGATGEAWGKALALALLDQARAAKRDFAGVLFSSAHEVRTFRFPAQQPVDINDVIEFTEHFFNGGTDYEAPLSVAAELLESEYNAVGRARGDIVFVTDGVCSVSEDWKHQWDVTKAQLGFRTYGVAIGSSAAAKPGSVLDALSDNLRNVKDLTDIDNASDLFHVI